MGRDASLWFQSPHPYLKSLLSLPHSRSPSVPLAQPRDMQFDDYSLGEPAAWGAVSPQAGDIVRDAMMKEKVIKFVGYALSKLTRTEPQFSSFIGKYSLARTICVVRSPSSLFIQRVECSAFPLAMLGRVDTVQKEVDKLVSENETLQMYIDNLTVQMAKRR